jgi:hypothetical protein
MTRRAASLTSSLMARKGNAGPSRLEDQETERLNGRPAPRLVASAPEVGKKSAPAKPRKDSEKDSEPAADKRRFTLRLSEDQHIRMRLASVHLHMSAQQMVMKALDQFLAQTVPHIRGGDCACMEAGEDGCLTPSDNGKGTK